MLVVDAEIPTPAALSCSLYMVEHVKRPWEHLSLECFYKNSSAVAHTGSTLAENNAMWLVKYRSYIERWGCEHENVGSDCPERKGT